MKKNISIILVLLFSLLAAGNIKSQSLDSLISEGLKNNPGIISLERNISSAEYKGKSAGYLPPPTIGVEVSQVPFKDPSLDNAISQNLVISQMVMTGGKLSAMEEAESKQAGIISADLDSYKQELMKDISDTYYDIWMLEHHIGLRKDNIDLINNILKSSAQYYQVNRSSYSDLLLLKAELASNKNEIDGMDNELNSMYYMMNSLLGRRDRDAEINVMHSLEPDTTALDSAKLEQFVIDNNPSLLKMDRMQEMNRLEIAANNKEWYPDLMLQGMVMRMPQGMLLTAKNSMPPMDEAVKPEYMFSLMASVTLPFAPWSSGKIENRGQELLSSVEGLSTERQNMENMLRSRFYALLSTVKSTGRQMKVLKEEVIPLYQQSLQSQVTEFQSGRNSILNIIQTNKMLLMKEEEYAEIVMKHQKQLAEIKSLTALNRGSDNEGFEK